MNTPRKHHYLPKFYLERWATNGQVFRYLRPLGENGHLDCKKKSLKAVAYEPDLYQQPDISDLRESQSLEYNFFQKIDNKAAIALKKLDLLEHGSVADRVALSQFMISLLHRSPSRLNAMKKELLIRTEGAPYESLTGAEFERLLKSTANRLLASLVDSDFSTTIVSKFKAFRIDVSNSSKTLLTSDRPITVSTQLTASDAFMILPYAPNKLAILAHNKDVVNAFSSQNPNVLVNGINQAVVEQSEDIIIASNNRAKAMIDRLFLRPQSNRSFDTIGLIRRTSPLVDLKPRVRNFSRTDKKAMNYL